MLACFLAGDRAPRRKLMSRSANRQALLQAAQKDSEAYEGNGVLEYGNIGVLGFKRINPSFHPSTIPIFTMLKRGD
jgi:hypothetical protein